jgi:hypothetical protein
MPHHLRMRSASAIVVIAAALSLPMTFAAQAKTHHRGHHAKIYNTTRNPVANPASGVAPSAVPADYDYPTFPEGSPNYHGGNAS